MAGWYKQHTSELASLEAFARCGRIDLVTAWLRVTRWTVDHESDELPDSLRHEAETLEEAGLVVTFASRCKKLLDQRASMAEKREAKRVLVNSCELTSIHIDSRELTSVQVNSCDHQDKTIQDKTREKKRVPRKREPNFDEWVPKQDHIDIAKTAGVDMAQQRTAMGDWLKSTGKTYKDYDAFARGWLRRARSAPTWKTAVNPLSCGDTDDTKTWKNPYGETL